MNFIIPANLDLAKLFLSKKSITIKRRCNQNGRKVVVEKEYDTKKLIKHLPYCYYLIDTIIKQSERKEIVRLSTEIIELYIPEPTRVLITNALKTFGVIIVSDHYTQGKCKTYRLHDDYLNQGFTTVSATSKFDDKVTKVYSEKTDNLLSNPHYPEYSFQKNQLLNIRFNADAASKFAYDLLHNQNITRGEYDYMMNKIESISKGITDEISINNTVNRFFSPITNLNKELRQFITDDSGTPLIEIDFTSSHLQHLICMLLNKKGRDIIILKKDKEGRKPNVPTFFEETLRLLNIIQTTGIYEYVQSAYQKDFNEVINRDEAKDLFITRFLYGMYPNQHKSKWVHSLFPEISAVITSIDRDELSKYLMQEESKLLNNAVIRRISKEVPNAILFGIFDSVLVNEDCFDEVYNIMIEEGNRFFDFETVVKVKRIQPEPPPLSTNQQLIEMLLAK